MDGPFLCADCWEHQRQLRLKREHATLDVFGEGERT